MYPDCKGTLKAEKLFCGAISFSKYSFYFVPQ